MEGTQIEQPEIFVKENDEITGITPEAADKLKEAGYDDKAIEEMSYEDVEKNLTAKPEEYEITEDQAKELVKLGYSQEEISAMTEEDVNGALEGEPEPATITEDMAKDFAFAKNMVGQPITALLKTMQNMQSEIGRLRNASKTKPKEIEKPEVNEDQFPDPLEDHNGWSNAILDALDKRFDAKLQGFQSQQNAKDIEKEFFSDLKSQLPEGVDPKKALDLWRAQEGAYLPEALAEVYSNNPDLAIKAISDWAKINMKVEKKEPRKRNKAQDVKDAITGKSKENLKYNATPRPKEAVDNSINDVVSAIIFRNTR